MSKEAQAIVTLLDQQYEQLLTDARCLVASYVDASMKLYKKTGVKSVEYPYRHLVLQVEGRLAEIRRVASENRQLRRTLVAYEKKLSRYQALNYGDLYSAG
jgi:hypothetical protein